MLDKDSKVLEFLPNEPQNKGPIPQFYGHLVFTTLFAQAYITPEVFWHCLMPP